MYKCLRRLKSQSTEIKQKLPFPQIEDCSEVVCNNVSKKTAKAFVESSIFRVTLLFCNINFVKNDFRKGIGIILHLLSYLRIGQPFCHSETKFKSLSFLSDYNDAPLAANNASSISSLEKKRCQRQDY